MSVVLVAAGAAIGAVARFLASGYLDREVPWGTLVVNVAGSFLLGGFAAWSLSGRTWAFAAVGLCGGLTTFSAFAAQTYDRGWWRGGAYAVLTVVCAVAACALGFALAQA